MKNKLSQYQKLQQRLSLTPQMRQSMQLLSMSVMELSEYVDSVLEKNPFLNKEADKKPPKVTAAESLDYISTKAAKENPRLSLLSNLRTLDLSEKEMEIAEYLIYEMDDNGYINIDIEEIAGDLSFDKEEIEKVLRAIQGMTPAGIGARDVRECLELQLKRKNKENSLEYVIVTNFMNELATSDVRKIANALKADEKAVAASINNIKKLNPRPAANLLSRETEPVIPDLIVRVKNNKVYLEINREWLPRLRLYNPYEEKLDVIKDPEVKDFLKNNMNAAKDLIDCIKRREETMCRVTEYIVNTQKDVLSQDISKIKSLTRRDVAEALGVHPSTISRTVANKYIQINEKILPLENLLSHSIKKENGEIVSKTSVKSRIKEFIESEDKARPFSDDTIRNMLEKEGVVIKRRTIAKYRESLRILPTHLRRNKSLTI